MDGNSGGGGWYINEQMWKYTPLLLCMNYSKELDRKKDKVINLVFRCIWTVFKQDGGGAVQ